LGGLKNPKNMSDPEPTEYHKWKEWKKRQEGKYIHFIGEPSLPMEYHARKKILDSYKKK